MLYSSINGCSCHKACQSRFSHNSSVFSIFTPSAVIVVGVEGLAMLSGYFYSQAVLFIPQSTRPVCIDSPRPWRGGGGGVQDIQRACQWRGGAHYA